MISRMTNIGEANPVGHPSGRFYPPPVSIAQARARVVSQLRHVEDNCRDGIDVRYAQSMLDEAFNDWQEEAFAAISR